MLLEISSAACMSKTTDKMPSAPRWQDARYFSQLRDTAGGGGGWHFSRLI
jgi:hypothetical protein